MKKEMWWMRTKAELHSIFDNLNYPWGQFTADHFTDYIGNHVRRRPIKTFAIYNLAKPMCMAGKRIDFVFHSSSIARVLQIHHKLHEVGHLLLGHVKSITYEDTDDVTELIQRIAVNFRSVSPSDDPQVAAEENEAEYFAYLVREKVYKHHRMSELMAITHRTDLYLPPFSGKFAKSED
jgi:hypothetical protein